MLASTASVARRQDRRGTFAVLVALLLTVASLVPGVALAPAASAAPRLDVVLSGRFDGPEHTGVIAATVSPKAFSSATTTPPPTLPVILTAGCTDAAPCTPGEGTVVSWDFGDGSRVTTDKLAVAHPYREPGVYTVRSRVSTAAGVGEDEVKVLVSPRYADADADLADKPGRADREAIWAASALGLLDVCRPAFPSVDGVDPSSTDVNRGVFCPEPSKSYGPTSAPSMPAGATKNGLTGASCLATWDSCGLPVAAFAAATGNPQAACVESCAAALRSQGLLDATNRLVYDPTNCLDGWTAARQGGSWVVTPGTEPGCVSRADFFRALVTALDGAPATDAKLLAPESVCVDATTTPGALDLRRAAALGLPVAHQRSGAAYCDGAVAVSKAEVYQALAKASGLPQSAPVTLRDLADTTLGRGARSAHPAAGAIGALMAKGVVLVGTTSCVDGVGTCFVPGEAVTRSQLSSLLAGLFVGMPSLASGLQIGITPASNPMAVGSTIDLKVAVRVPASYPADAPLVVSWPPVSDKVSTRGCPATQTVTAGPSRLVQLTCSYTRSVPGTSALAVSVRDRSGNVASASVPLVATNSSPQLTPVTFPAFDEDTVGQVVVPATDQEDTPLAFHVRSVLPSEQAPQSYPMTGKSPTLSWQEAAETAVGQVRVVSVTKDSATVSVTPAADVYGAYSFAVEACDNSTCSSQVVKGVVNPVNDAPRARAVVGATGPHSKVLEIRMSGSDPSDQGRPGYAGVGIDLYRIDSLPELGTLYYDSDPGAGTSYVAAAKGATTNNPVLQFKASHPSEVKEEADAFRYSVRDTGHPGSAWSSSAGVGLVVLDD